MSDREDYAQEWRDHIYALAEHHGLTVVDVETGRAVDENGQDLRPVQQWVEVRERASGDIVYALTGNPVDVVADLVQVQVAGRWITGEEIEAGIAEMLDERFGSGEAAA